MKSKRPAGRVASQSLVSLEMCAGMIVEDQLDRSAGRIGGIEKFEEFDELFAAVAISDERVDLSSEQINPGQQAECAIAFVLMIPREGGMDTWHRWQIRRRVFAKGIPTFLKISVWFCFRPNHHSLLFRRRL
jgi:hypothetical protein